MEQNTTNLQSSDITKQAEIPCYACGYLLLVCIIETITGSIHFFAPDGGAGTIAGFDLVPGSAATTQIIYLFAVLGTCQYAFVIMYLYFIIKRRDLVPLGLWIVLFNNGIGILTDNWYKAPPGFFPHKIGTILYFVLTAIVLILLKVQANRRMKTGK